MPSFQPILISLCIHSYQLHYCLALHHLPFPLLRTESIARSVLATGVLVTPDKCVCPKYLVS
jgi:hypothetical protein